MCYPSPWLCSPSSLPRIPHRAFIPLVYLSLYFSVDPCEIFVNASMIPVFCSLVFLCVICKSCYLFSHLSVLFFCDPSPLVFFSVRILFPRIVLVCHSLFTWCPHIYPTCSVHVTTVVCVDLFTNHCSLRSSRMDLTVYHHVQLYLGTKSCDNQCEQNWCAHFFLVR